MKRWVVGLIVLMLSLSACGTRQEGPSVLTRVILDRSHGSMWGDQFYMDVCADEILQTYYFLPDDPGGELVEESGLPITSEQWAEIATKVKELEPSLIPVRETIWKKLFNRGGKLDGTESHHLTLYWADDEGIDYQWPDNEHAAALEKLLEQLTLE